MKNQSLKHGVNPNIKIDESNPHSWNLAQSMGSSDHKDAVGESGLYPINMVNSRENSIANTPRANLAVLNKTQPILTQNNNAPTFTKGV